MSSNTLAGTVIDEKFRLDEQIGEGSMGAVYRGTQLMVDRPVAVKLLHPGFAGHDKIQARFEVEARAIAKLNHPNCITLFDFGYSEEMEAFYTVVEYIDGDSLEQLIGQRPALDRVVELVKQAGSALGHAHHHGILHRDLKPENIMLDEMTDGSEMAKVLDFGIAQIMQGHGGDEEDEDFESNRLTRVGEVFGTPPYMSPEQSESTHDLTPATDLYSLGVIFYELIEGRLPFIADTPAQVMMMHREKQPPPLERPGVPESVQSILFQMLDKDPEARPESGDKIAEMLEAIPERELTGGPSSGGPDTPPESETDPTLTTSPTDAEPERGEESTILSAPPESDAVAAATDIDERGDARADAPSPPDGPAPSPASRPGRSRVRSPETHPDSAPGSPEPATPESGSSSGTATVDRPSVSDNEVKSTRLLDEGRELEPTDKDDPALDSEVGRLADHRRKMIGAVVLTMALAGGLLTWFYIEYDPFSMAAEEEMDGAADVAASAVEETEEDENADEPTSPGVDEPAPTDEESVEDRGNSEPPRKVAVSDADQEETDQDEESEKDADDADDEESESTGDAEETTTTEPRPTPDPEPSPRPAAGDDSAPRDGPARLDGPGDSDDSEDGEDRPPRLDL